MLSRSRAALESGKPAAHTPKNTVTLSPLSPFAEGDTF